MGEIIKVEWLDSGGLDEVWTFKDDWELHPHRIVSVGILVTDDKDKLVICQSENDDQYGRLFAIPKGCITSRRKL